jgi:hypothetical protein
MQTMQNHGVIPATSCARQVLHVTLRHSALVLPPAAAVTSRPTAHSSSVQPHNPLRLLEPWAQEAEERRGPCVPFLDASCAPHTVNCHSFLHCGQGTMLQTGSDNLAAICEPIV